MLDYWKIGVISVSSKGFKIHLEPHSFILHLVSQLVKNLPAVWEIQV